MLGSCDFSGDLDCIAKKLYIFVIFQGGGGGSRPLIPPSESAHGGVHALSIGCLGENADFNYLLYHFLIIVSASLLKLEDAFCIMLCPHSY